MTLELSAVEARVIGCLIEKQITTPDQYPLSLNALLSACNQKSNREPVMSLDEPAVQRTLAGLSKRHLVVERAGFGSRVPKFQHRFCNTEFGSLKLDAAELAVVCELLLRGPQTPGELRARAGRMAPFADVTVVEGVLTRLMERPEGPLVERLPLEPGRRETRFAHLFAEKTAERTTGHFAEATVESGADARAVAAGSDAPEVAFPNARNEERLLALEQQMRELRAELEDLKRRLP